MALSDVLKNIKKHISKAYTKAAEKGATIPAKKTLGNLSNTIASIDIYPNDTAPIYEGPYELTNDAVLSVAGKRMSQNITVVADSAIAKTLRKLGTNWGGVFYSSSATSSIWNSASVFLKNFEELSLVDIPEDVVPVDTSAMFNNCQFLKKIPLFNTSAVTNMSSMFAYCYVLESIPAFNTSNVASMNKTFYGCMKIKTIPLLITSNVIYMQEAFSYCYELEEIPLIDTSNVTNMSKMFYYCLELKTVPLLDFSSVIDVTYMFYNCYQLETIPAFDCDNVTTGLDTMLEYCTGLTAIHMINIGADFNISDCTLLDRQALLEIIGNLKANVERRLILGNTNLQKLTEEDIALATAKGRTVS